MSSWTIYPALIAFFTAGYYVLRWVQRKSTQINLPKLADGQWDPIVANYSWSMENKYKEEYDSGKVSGKIPASELGKLLMRRAMIDVEKAMEMSEQKDKLFSLVRGGSVGEDVWNHFLHVETSLEKEIEELMREADSLKPGWSNSIFAQARQLLIAERRREMESKQSEIETEQKSRESEKALHQDLVNQEKEEMAKKIAEELIREEEMEKQRRSITTKDQKNKNKKKKK